MKDTLRIGMQLLADLEMVRMKVVPCFPPHYNILQFFILQYATIANNHVILIIHLFIYRWNVIIMILQLNLVISWS